ncbi:S9 family peptidase [Luteimonas sp. RIT-PG2_3]
MNTLPAPRTHHARRRPQATLHALVARGLVLLAALLPSLAMAERADYAAAEAFTPKQVAKRLHGDAGIDDRRDDAFDRRYSVALAAPRWIDGSRYWFQQRDRSGLRVVIGDATTGTRNAYTGDRLLAVARAGAGEGGGAGRNTATAGNAQDLKIDGVEADGRLRFRIGDQRWQWQPGQSKATRQATAARPQLDEAVAIAGGGWLGVRDRNLWLQRADGTLKALSDDAAPWRSFGREGGITDTQTPLGWRLGWFEGGRRFWVERGDNRKVGASWLVDTGTTPRPTLREMRYAMPGEADLPVTELWIGDLDSESLVRVDSERWPGQFIGSTDIGNAGGGISAGGSRDKLYFARMSRGYGEVELVVADAATGKTRVLLHERGTPYFTLRAPTFRVLSDGSVLWLSDRSGWNHLYRYDADGTLVGAVTEGAFNIAQILGIDEDGGWLYVSGYGREPGVHRHYAQSYRVALAGGRIERLTPEDADHASSLSPDGRWLIDTHSRPDLPTTSVLRDREGKQVAELQRLDIVPLRAAGWQPPESVETLAADGKTVLHGGIWKPFDFDPTRRYPVIAWVMPNSSSAGSIPVRFEAASPMQALAQLGFIVVTSATRGQAQGVRDKAYLVHGHGNMRDYPLADSRASLEQLAASRPWMDLSRVGVTGYSGGGLMSVSLFLTYPELYRVCVSGAGNHDNNLYEWSSTEHYYGLDVPIPSNAALAGNLKGRLLLVHSDLDKDVQFAHSVRLADALVNAGKRYDFLLIPGRDHDLADRQGYFERSRWVYFAQHLLGDTRERNDLLTLDRD